MSFASGRQRAFTLIELLIVITIIGILAVSLLPRLMGGTALARDASRKADLNQIATALEFYYSSNASYPGTGANGCINSATMTSALGGSFSGGTVPNDPQSLPGTLASGATCATGYVYNALGSGGAAPTATRATSYVISAQLETAGDNGSNVYKRGSFGITAAQNATTNFSTNGSYLCSTLAGTTGACNATGNTAAFVIGR